MSRHSLAAILSRPRDFLGTEFIYAVVSQRAGGLSIGINLNPEKKCNFDCVYCEVKNPETHRERQVDLAVLSKELRNVLTLLQLGKFRELPGFAQTPPELMVLKNVTISGNGEPTLCPNFHQAVQEVVRIRQVPQYPAFKLVLITNGTGLHLSGVQEALKLFSEGDEVWIKLDAGTQIYMTQVNRTRFPMETVLNNIRVVGVWRPVVIQSLFCSIQGEGPSDLEIEQYVQRLADLVCKGTKIRLVQIYSAVREPAGAGCGHLPLARLSYIARRVREGAGLRAEVY